MTWCKINPAHEIDLKIRNCTRKDDEGIYNNVAGDQSAYEELFLCVGMSLLWWAGLFLVVTGAPATMGIDMSPTDRQTINGQTVVSFGKAHASICARVSFSSGFRSLCHPHLPSMFGSMPIVKAGSVSSRWSGFGFYYWLLISQYLFPLFWQQDEPNIRLAFRNAALLTAKYPLYSLLLFLFQILLIFICVAVVLPLPLLLPAMIALAQNFGTLGLLQEMGLAPEPPEAEVDRRG